MGLKDLFADEERKTHTQEALQRLNWNQIPSLTDMALILKHLYAIIDERDKELEDLQTRMNRLERLDGRWDKNG